MFSWEPQPLAAPPPPPRLHPAAAATVDGSPAYQCSLQPHPLAMTPAQHLEAQRQLDAAVQQQLDAAAAMVAGVQRRLTPPQRASVVTPPQAAARPWARPPRPPRQRQVAEDLFQQLSRGCAGWSEVDMLQRYRDPSETGGYDYTRFMTRTLPTEYGQLIQNVVLVLLPGGGDTRVASISLLFDGRWCVNYNYMVRGHACTLIDYALGTRTAVDGNTLRGKLLPGMPPAQWAVFVACHPLLYRLRVIKS